MPLEIGEEGDQHAQAAGFSSTSDSPKDTTTLENKGDLTTHHVEPGLSSTPNNIYDGDDTMAKASILMSKFQEINQAIDKDAGSTSAERTSSHSVDQRPKDNIIPNNSATEDSRDRNENESDTGSDSGSDSNDYQRSDSASQSESDVEYAGSRFTSRTLYNAYRIRLEKNAEERTMGKHVYDEGHALFKGLADYLRVMEERIERLESEQPPKDSGTRQDDNELEVEKQPEEKGKQENDATVQTGTGGKIRQDENGALTSFHDYRWERNLVFHPGKPVLEGPFCDNDVSFVNPNPRYVLRVLYKWTGKSRGPDTTEILLTQPDPAHVSILGIRIHSLPIASFLEMQTRFKMDKDSIMQFSNPFKIIIRHAKAIQNQLDILETRYGSAKAGSSFVAEEDNKATPSPDDVKEPVKSSDNEVLDQEEDTLGAKLESKAEDKTEEDQVSGAEEPPHNSKIALLHFRELVAFMDKYLEHKLGLYEKYQTGDHVKIMFEDVWMIFDLNTTILCTSRSGKKVMHYGKRENDFRSSVRRYVPQAYRVMNAFGGTLTPGGFVPRIEGLLVGGEKQGRGDPKSGLNQRNLQASELQLLQFLGLLQEQLITEKVRNRFNQFMVYCYFIDFHGPNLGVVTEVFVIEPFEGEVEVTSLEAFPIAFQKHLGSQQERTLDLKQRGLRFLELTQAINLEHNGLTVGETQEELNGPVMIDFGIAYEEMPHLIPTFNELWNSPSINSSLLEIPRADCNHKNASNSCCLVDHNVKYELYRVGIMTDVKRWVNELDVTKKHQLETVKDQFIKSDFAVLLPGVVYGFALQSRKWRQFNIPNLSNPEWAEGDSGWDDLVLPDAHRSIVQSMVETHAAGATRSNESKYDMGLVQGKGKGCIILLHGVPGVGKTSTAECVAAYTRRPLFPITCGDIGYEPEQVEENLEKLFRLAHRWGCVMLIDEADVFLAERDKADVKRNGLVSVFLRVLEYYSGILFLTTNRVGAFDEAFRSRIHLSLYYPKLSEEQSHGVWNMNIRRIAKLNKQRKLDGLRSVRYDKEEILEWAECNYQSLSWNGRQIQNAFQTALALAEFKVRRKPLQERKPEITIRDFRTIGEATIQFDNYLMETYMGMDEAKTAKKKQIRADEWGKKGKSAPGREIQMPTALGYKSKYKSKSKSTGRVSRKSYSSETGSSQDESEPSSESEEEKKTKKKKKDAEKVKAKGGKKEFKVKKKVIEASDDNHDTENDASETSEDDKAKQKAKKKATKNRASKSKTRAKKSHRSEEEGQTETEEISQDEKSRKGEAKKSRAKRKEDSDDGSEKNSKED